MLIDAEDEWLKVGLRDSYVSVEANLNSRRSEVARKNQVIFAVGQCDSHQFDSSKIEELVRKHFPSTVREGQVLGIGAILSELFASEKPLLTRSVNGNQYRVRDPRFVMCIRLMLFKDGGGKVM